MSNFIRRRVATPDPARWYRWVSITCAWMLTTAVVQAAETPSMTMDIGAAQPSFLLFNQYQGWRDEPLQDWAAANRRVGEIGGWLTYLRQAQQGSHDAGQSGATHHEHHGN